MASMSVRLARAWLRRVVKKRVARDPTVRGIRDALNGLPLHGLTHGVMIQHGTVGGVAREVARPIRGPVSSTILYVHGGGFVALSPTRYRAITCALARAGFEVVAPDYRLAPRHPFPGALEDVMTAYRECASREHPFVVAGDSAGGGLALSAMLRAAGDGVRSPVCAVLFSPWVDLSLRGPLLDRYAQRCTVLSAESLQVAAAAYLFGADPHQPAASPIYGDLGRLPPLLIHVGSDEALFEDAQRLSAGAHLAGVRARLRVLSMAPHGIQLLHPFVPESRVSLREAVAFIHTEIARQARGTQCP